MKFFTLALLLSVSINCLAAMETTSYGKITGFETRSWGMHVQVDFSVGAPIGCKVDPGAAYMLDLNKSNINQNGEGYEFAQSLILAAFVAQKPVSFHLYSCASGRPQIGHIRVKN